jgi:hypothetical protein
VRFVTHHDPLMEFSRHRPESARPWSTVYTELPAVSCRTDDAHRQFLPAPTVRLLGQTPSEGIAAAAADRPDRLREGHPHHTLTDAAQPYGDAGPQASAMMTVAAASLAGRLEPNRFFMRHPATLVDPIDCLAIDPNLLQPRRGINSRYAGGRPSELAKRCQLVIGIPLGRSRLVRRMRNLFLLRTPVTTVPS